MVWKVTGVNDDGFLKIEIRDKETDLEPLYVHNMKPASVDKKEATKEIQQHVDAVWEKIQLAKANPQPTGSNLIGLSG